MTEDQTRQYTGQIRSIDIGSSDATLSTTFKTVRIKSGNTRALAVAIGALIQGSALAFTVDESGPVPYVTDVSGTLAASQ